MNAVVFINIDAPIYIISSCMLFILSFVFDSFEFSFTSLSCLVLVCMVYFIMRLQDLVLLSCVSVRRLWPPPDAHIGEHALTLDFRALEKILKDVCSFDFCLIHVSWFCCWGLGGVVGCDLMGSNWSVWGFVRCICLCRERRKLLMHWCMAMQLPMVSGVLQVLRIEKQSFYCCITSDVKSLW